MPTLTVKPPMSRERSLNLHKAVASNDVKIIRRLISAGADVDIADRFGCSPLHWAASGGKVDICRILLAAGANPDALESRSLTPLRYAVANGCAKVATVLLANDASIDLRGYDGQTALHVAAQDRNEEICRLLLDGGADLTAIDHQGLMPICFAIKKGALALCQLFEERLPGISARQPGDGLPTPFQFAVATGEVDLVRYFVVECGADLQQKTANGQSMLELAEDEEQMQVLLRSLNTEALISDALGSSDAGEVRRRSGLAL